MSANLTLYTAFPSRGNNVLWMLEECEARYEVVPLALGPALKTPEFLAINPMGKVPALKHGEAVITETVAILSYLAELHPHKQLIPAAATPERGAYYRWLCLALHLEYAAFDRWRGVHNTAEQRIAIGYGDFDTLLATLKNHLQGRDHIVGQTFSALDVYYSGLLAFLIHRAQAIPADPLLLAYMQRHLARPAFARAEQMGARFAPEKS
ncbi:glutathione S-transferase family protein [Vandammella animalimorsus]|uniref:glutathione S-transferase family protein n=1 Tax=Vandammella animalimorsus TaxID=2029117 RepID=UPI00325BACF4